MKARMSRLGLGLPQQESDDGLTQQERRPGQNQHQPPQPPNVSDGLPMSRSLSDVLVSGDAADGPPSPEGGGRGMDHMAAHKRVSVKLTQEVRSLLSSP